MTATVTLPAGTQTLVVDQDNGGWNIHAMNFAPTGVTSSWFEVVNQSSGLCATAAGGSTANGTAVEQSACTGAASQLWKFMPTSVSGYYDVVNNNAQSEGETWNITGGTGATGPGRPAPDMELRRDRQHQRPVLRQASGPRATTPSPPTTRACA